MYVCVHVSLYILFYRYIHTYARIHTVENHVSTVCFLLVCECFVLGENWERMVKWRNSSLSSIWSQSSQTITFLGFVQNQLIYCGFGGTRHSQQSRKCQGRLCPLQTQRCSPLERTHSSKVAIWPPPHQTMRKLQVTSSLLVLFLLC